jgi:hypothetical protein
MITINLSCSWNMSKCKRIPKIDDYGRFFNVGMVGAKWGFLNLPTLIPLHLCMHQQPNNQHIHSLGRTYIYQEEPMRSFAEQMSDQEQKGLDVLFSDHNH